MTFEQPPRHGISLRAICGVLLLSALAVGCAKERVRNSPATVSSSDDVMLRSPGGGLVAAVVIEQLADRKGRWQVMTIRNPDGDEVFRDNKSGFVAQLNIYWRWDGDERLWIYNSDDGSAWHIDREGGQWVKYECVAATDAAPPVELYPPGIREELENRVRDGRVPCD